MQPTQPKNTPTATIVKKGAIGVVNGANKAPMTTFTDDVPRCVPAGGKVPKGRADVSFCVNYGHELKQRGRLALKKAGLKTMVFDEVFVRDYGDNYIPNREWEHPLACIPDGVEEIYIGSLIVYEHDECQTVFNNLPMTVNRVFIGALYTIDGYRVNSSNYTGYYQLYDESEAILRKHIRLPYGAVFQMGDFTEFTVASKKGARCFYIKEYDWGCPIYTAKKMKTVKVAKRCYHFEV